MACLLPRQHAGSRVRDARWRRPRAMRVTDTSNVENAPAWVPAAVPDVLGCSPTSRGIAARRPGEFPEQHSQFSKRRFAACIYNRVVIAYDIHVEQERGWKPRPAEFSGTCDGPRPQRLRAHDAAAEWHVRDVIATPPASAVPHRASGLTGFGHRFYRETKALPQRMALPTPRRSRSVTKRPVLLVSGRPPAR
jgi:hypothetical protein